MLLYATDARSVKTRGVSEAPHSANLGQRVGELVNIEAGAVELGEAGIALSAVHELLHSRTHLKIFLASLRVRRPLPTNLRLGAEIVAVLDGA